ncbi:hypothetical protein PNP85_06670, partial [Halobacterium salinarum]|uniref:hypothetical protein n=1 Tax=Halobacterium salinarum TaxID=2242 RepID=UPI00255787A2
AGISLLTLQVHLSRCTRGLLLMLVTGESDVFDVVATLFRLMAATAPDFLLREIVVVLLDQVVNYHCQLLLIQ